jgi:hypothetical protein
MRDKVVVDDMAITVLCGMGELAEGVTIQVKVRNVPEPEIVIASGLIDLLG